MTTYRQVKGYSIKSVASDPDNAKVGQVWYNSTELKLKNKLTIAAAWASGGNYPDTTHGLQGDGTQTAAFAAGGSADLDSTKEYDGSSWTAGGNMGTNRYTFGANGTQTAGLAVAGFA